MRAVSNKSPLNHYRWGEGCDGWNLVDEPSLSVKQERMPAGCSEKTHLHQYAQQFFFILSGIAVFEMEGRRIEVASNQGIHVPPGTPHRISNESREDLQFLLCSQPSSAKDRINCP